MPKQLFTFTVWHNGDSWLLSLSLLGQNDMVTLINSLCYTSFISHGSGCLLYSICPRLSQISAVSLSQTHMPVYLELQEWVSLRTENIQAQNRAAVTFELPQRGGGGVIASCHNDAMILLQTFFFREENHFLFIIKKWIWECRKKVIELALGWASGRVSEWLTNAGHLNQ